MTNKEGEDKNILYKKKGVIVTFNHTCWVTNKQSFRELEWEGKWPITASGGSERQIADNGWQTSLYVTSEVCRGKFPMLSEHLTHSWDRPHTPLRLTGCNEEDFNAHVGQTPSPSGNKDGNEQTLSACTDLSMRIASVFRSFSSQVSLSSAMIFSDSWTKGKLWEKQTCVI